MTTEILNEKSIEEFRREFVIPDDGRLESWAVEQNKLLKAMCDCALEVCKRKAKMLMIFAVEKEELAVIHEWSAKLERATFGEETPYYGAIGGELEYRFTPTSLGTILTVKYSNSDEVLNVTEKLGWEGW